MTKNVLVTIILSVFKPHGVKLFSNPNIDIIGKLNPKLKPRRPIPSIKRLQGNTASIIEWPGRNDTNRIPIINLTQPNWLSTVKETSDAIKRVISTTPGL